MGVWMRPKRRKNVRPHSNCPRLRMKNVSQKVFLTSRILFTFLIGVLLSSVCSSSREGKLEDRPVIETIAVSPSPQQTPKKIANENFEKEWKSQYQTASEELETNRALWQESKIVNYDFVVGKMMGGTTSPWNRLPVLIKVRDRIRTSIELEKEFEGTYMERLDGFEEIDTIDNLFEYLRRELENGNILEMNYDKKLGYPKRSGLVFDFHSHGTRYIDISKFEAVK